MSFSRTAKPFGVGATAVFLGLPPSTQQYSAVKINQGSAGIIGICKSTPTSNSRVIRTRSSDGMKKPKVDVQSSLVLVIIIVV